MPTIDKPMLKAIIEDKTIHLDMDKKYINTVFIEEVVKAYLENAELNTSVHHPKSSDPSPSRGLNNFHLDNTQEQPNA